MCKHSDMFSLAILIGRGLDHIDESQDLSVFGRNLFLLYLSSPLFSFQGAYPFIASKQRFGAFLFAKIFTLLFSGGIVVKVIVMYLREFTQKDAENIVSWLGDETAFRKWAVDTYKDYPISSEDILARYEVLREEYHGGFCAVVAVEDDRVLGHFIMRVIDENEHIVRFGYIIVNPNIRGRGTGTQMLRLGAELAKERFSAQKITLGVFDNNPSAYNCYNKVGFTQSQTIKPTTYKFFGEDWLCLEMEYNV